MDERAHALWGVPRDGPLTFADLSARIAPPDLDRVQAAFAATWTTPGPYQIDFRILLPDGIQWVSARGRGADKGIVGRIMFGVFLDSTARKEAEEARETLAGEMGHRGQEPVRHRVQPRLDGSALRGDDDRDGARPEAALGDAGARA